jgi:hypothetical protein
MISNILVRLALAMGANVATFSIFFLFARFGMADQGNISQAVLENLQDNPMGVQVRIDDLVGQLITTGAAAIGVAFVLAVVWLVMVEMNPPVGDVTARAKRQTWAGLLILTVIGAIAAGWLLLIDAPIANSLASGVAVTGTAVAVLLAIIGYWLGTGLGAPRACKVAVPGFGG